MASEMIERVSEAVMAEARRQTGGRDDSPASGLDFDGIARAAVEAMRGPPSDMVALLDDRGDSEGFGKFDTREVLGKIIDAALKD
jgi:hypothetical protein